LKLAVVITIAATAAASSALAFVDSSASPAPRKLIFVAGYTGLPCDDTPCWPEDAPVCGSNGITYENACELDLAKCNDSGLNVTQVSTGACPTQSE
ncbi:hypothetical protein PHYSODRAFT_529929, partial [Phytophthora sojae]